MFENNETDAHQLSDHQRLKKLNTFIQANPRRSAWTIQQWLLSSIKNNLFCQSQTSGENGEEFTQVLHLLLSLNAATLDILYQYLDLNEVVLLKEKMAKVITLGDQSLAEVILAFYHTCQDYEPEFISRDKAEQVKGSSTRSSSKRKQAEKKTGPKKTEQKKISLLEQIPSSDLALVLQREQPQLIALILSQLDGQKSAEILSHLPEQLHSEICLKIIHLDPPNQEWLNLIQESLLTEVKKVADTQTQYSLTQLADLLNELTHQEAEELLKNINEEDSQLANELEEKRFTFDDLVCVDDRGIQYLIKQIASTSWQLALRETSQAVKEKIFSNMSQRAQDILREELQLQPRRALNEIKKMQKEILQVVIRLEKAGKLSISHPAFTLHEYV